MQRLLALATLLVLSLSRFGAPAPVHARTWVVERVTSELGAAVPGARLAAPMPRELVPRTAPRAIAPWLPFHAAPTLALELLRDARPRAASSIAPAPHSAWRRFTYDATAPPRLS